MHLAQSILELKVKLTTPVKVDAYFTDWIFKESTHNSTGHTLWFILYFNRIEPLTRIFENDTHINGVQLGSRHSRLSHLAHATFSAWFKSIEGVSAGGTVQHCNVHTGNKRVVETVQQL